MKINDAYNEGLAAHSQCELEPVCHYEPGTGEYKDFADGFCENINVDVICRQPRLINDNS